MTDVGPLILVVEDEAPLRKFIRASLNSHGYRMLEADCARDVAMLVTSHNPELILMDLGLPDGDGLDLTEQLREWTRVPIIVISARGREDDKVAALDAGADDYLQNAGKVLTYRHILNEIWGATHAMQTHNVRVHMAELRRKIETGPSRPKLFTTEPGVGYRLRDRG